jgi:type IV pilus biogenesis protein CpaD/CtpE
MKVFSPRLLAVAAPMLVVLALGGCDSLSDKSGEWHPMGANAMNLELEVARPSDLLQGRGADGSDGNTAAQAIDRLRHDKVKPIKSMDTLSTSSGGGS